MIHGPQSLIEANSVNSEYFEDLMVNKLRNRAGVINLTLSDFESDYSDF